MSLLKRKRYSTRLDKRREFKVFTARHSEPEAVADNTGGTVDKEQLTTAYINQVLKL